MEKGDKEVLEGEGGGNFGGFMRMGCAVVCDTSGVLWLLFIMGDRAYGGGDG